MKRYAMPWRSLLLVSVLAAGTPVEASGSAPTVTEGSQPGEKPTDSENGLEATPEPWWSQSHDDDYISIGMTTAPEPDEGRTRGIRLGYGGAYDDEFSGRVLIWLGVRQGDGQHHFDFRVDAVPFNVGLGPVRFGPLVNAGLQYRQDEPHQGLGAVAGIGAELAIWLGRRIQIAAVAERDFALGQFTVNQVAFDLRWTIKRHDHPTWTGQP
jgi:hypothetical protein